MQITRRRRIFSGIALFLAGGIADAVFGWGLTHMLTSYADDLTWADIQAQPWGGILSVLLMLAGMGLLVWPNKGPNRPTPQQRARGLAARGDDIASRINNHRHWDNTAMEMRDPLARVISEGASLLITYEKEGFAVPDFDGLNENRRIAFTMLAYFSRIAPLLRDGHLDVAKTASREIADVAVEEALSLTM